MRLARNSIPDPASTRQPGLDPVGPIGDPRRQLDAVVANLVGS